MASRRHLIARILATGTSFSPLPCQVWHGYRVTDAHRVEVEVGLDGPTSVPPSGAAAAAPPADPIIEQHGAAGATHGALRKSKNGVNRVIPDVRQHGGLAIFRYQRVKCVRDKSMLLTVKPLAGKEYRKLRRNPHDGVVRVCVNAERDETLRLHLQAVLQLTRVLS
jgi:hypothetical protein